MLWLVCYDITDDRARRRVERLLSGHGERVQLSVFECVMEDHVTERLRSAVAREIDPKVDSVRWYPLCAWCEAETLVRGAGRRPDDAVLWLI